MSEAHKINWEENKNEKKISNNWNCNYGIITIFGCNNI